jgi:hypothetical protein
MDQDDENVSFSLFYLFSGTPEYATVLADANNNPGPFDVFVGLGNRQNLGWNNIIWSVESVAGTNVDVTYCVNGIYTGNLGSFEYTFGDFFPSNIYIGHSNLNNNYWQGDIGPVKIYNRSLSREEMLQNFNAHRGRYGV